MSNIFNRRESRELQNLRQRQSGAVIAIDPNLKGFTQRFNPDASRAAILRAQRARVPTAADLEKAVGVKTAKKLRRRRGKNLRGETARNIREQRRFERGERRDKPEQEPRIVGDPPPVPAAAAYDPALERRRLDLEEDRERNRQLERIADRRENQAAQERELAVRRGELAGARADRAAAQQRLAAPDPDAQLRLAIEGRRITAQDAQQRRLVEALGEERRDARVLAGRGELERKEAAELRAAEIREERNERALLAEQAADARLEDRDARLEREREIAAANVDRDERERGERIAQSEVTAKERRGELQAAGVERREESKQAREERREILEREIPDPVAEEERPADRNFLERQLERGLETIDRRIGESEARTAEQIRQHADRVSGAQPPIIIQQPPPAAAPAGPSAQEIAESIRLQLESPGTRERRERRERGPVRRLEIVEETTDTEEEEFSPTRSERRRRRQGRGSGSPTQEVTRRDPREEEEQEGGFSPIRFRRSDLSPQRPERTTPTPRQPSPERLPSPPREQVREEQPEGAIQLPGGDIDPFEGEEERPAEPAIVTEEDLFQSQEFQGNLEAAAQNAIGYVGDIAGGALGGLRGLFQAGDPAIGEQTGGALVTQEGEPIYGLGEEIEEPQKPTVQPLQSDTPERRLPAGSEYEFTGRDPEGVRGYKYVGRDPRTGPPKQTLEQFQEERRRKQAEGVTLQPIAETPESESSLEKNLRVAESELSTLQRRDRAAGQSSRGRAQAARSTGSLAGTRFARKVGGVPRAEIERAEEEVRRLQGLVAIEKEGERIREITEQAREAGTPRQGFTTEAPLEPLLQEVEQVALPSEQRTNSQLFDSMESEINSHYTRGRATGGARGSLPFTVTNTSNRKFKGLEPGQRIILDQIEADETLGYYPQGKPPTGKKGIVRIGRAELKRQIKGGKLKVDRIR